MSLALEGGGQGSGFEAGGSSGRDEEEGGLEAFEDVLSSWLTAAHSKTSQALMKAQASLPLRPRTAENPGGGPSTLARIQEQQQQQLVQEEGQGTGAGKKSKGLRQQKARSGGVGKKSKGARERPAAGAESAQQDEEEQEQPDSPTGIEGWKDVLSGWMTTAGVAALPQRAQQDDAEPVGHSGGKASRQEASGSAQAPAWLADVSSDDEDEEEGRDAPRTVLISDSKLLTAVSEEASGDASRHSIQTISSGNLAAASQQLSQHGSHSNLSFPPSPVQGYSAPSNSSVSAFGISSQDRKLEGDLLNRARSDPAALWPSPVPGFPVRAGQNQQAAPAVATSVAAPAYPADQGLPTQVNALLP